MGNYQAAFMRYRSTDDHIVRRVLDEKWKAGKPMNQEEWATLAQNKTEMKKAADELPETVTESSAAREKKNEE
ncbi:hypothetical protein EVAR_70911_1 [Eumeta japonica]|uniref:Uncharacterized protein n=1 Tax=Eumeta variegata TaxID=151549 RepID=A0A4C2AEY9_EUMVA|nr:hypothetical protein EVAR_70911_1 [Eumeta japonica]